MTTTDVIRVIESPAFTMVAGTMLGFVLSELVRRRTQEPTRLYDLFREEQQRRLTLLAEMKGVLIELGTGLTLVLRARRAVANSGLMIGPSYVHADPDALPTLARLEDELEGLRNKLQALAERYGVVPKIDECEPTAMIHLVYKFLEDLRHCADNEAVSLDRRLRNIAGRETLFRTALRVIESVEQRTLRNTKIGQVRDIFPYEDNQDESRIARWHEALSLDTSELEGRE